MSDQITLADQLEPFRNFIREQFNEVVKLVVEKRFEGACKIDIPYHRVEFLQGHEIIEMVRQCEESTGTMFDFMTRTSGDCTLTAVAPMLSASIDDQAAPDTFPDIESTVPTKKNGVKVPRPRNAFLIYRGAHHDSVKAQFPGIHNNEISKIIGSNWAKESQAVKDDYKRQAEDEKRQHAIDHPGYQYQPRKPSEKKKRMTKTKLAKLAAVSRGADAAIDASIPSGQNFGQLNVTSFMAPYQNNVSQITHLEGVPIATFDVVASEAGDEDLRNQLELLNVPFALPPMSSDFDIIAPVHMATPLTDGEKMHLAPRPLGFRFEPSEFPFGFDFDDIGPSGGTTFVTDPYAEQHRQEQLEMEMSQSLFAVEGDITNGIDSVGNVAADGMEFVSSEID